MHNIGFTIKTTQKGGGGPPSTIVPALKVLNKATANKQAIKAISPDKTFFKESNIEEGGEVRN